MHVSIGRCWVVSGSGDITGGSVGGAWVVSAAPVSETHTGALIPPAVVVSDTTLIPLDTTCSGGPGSVLTRKGFWLQVWVDLPGPGVVVA